MKILVPVKRVVDFNVKIRVKPDGSGVDTANVKMSMNPFDEVSVEAALQLKEAGRADEVIALSVGPAKAEETLRTALGMGADRAIHVETDEAVEPLAVAKILKRVVDDEGCGLVILGKQAIDGDCNQTGQMLAALMGCAQATYASKIEIGDGQATVTREIDGGLQTVAISLPAVITTDLRLCAPRFVSLPNIMKAKKKPLEKKSVADFGIDLTARLEVLGTEAPPARAPGVILGSVGELVEKLTGPGGVLEMSEAPDVEIAAAPGFSPEDETMKAERIAS